MSISGRARMGLAVAAALTLAACGGKQQPTPQINAAVDANNADFKGGPASKPTGKLGDLFGKSTDPNTSVRVNKYIWNAALDVLSFLPIE